MNKVIALPIKKAAWTKRIAQQSSTHMQCISKPANRSQALK